MVSSHPDKPNDDHDINVSQPGSTFSPVAMEEQYFKKWPIHRFSIRQNPALLRYIRSLALVGGWNPPGKYWSHSSLVIWTGTNQVVDDLGIPHFRNPQVVDDLGIPHFRNPQIDLGEQPPWALPAMGQRTLGPACSPGPTQPWHPSEVGASKWGLVYHHILVGYLTRFYLVDCKSSCSLKIMTLHRKFRAPAICSNPPNHHISSRESQIRTSPLGPTT